MSNPWANVEKLAPVSLNDIMSEELARDLQENKDNGIQKKLVSVHNTNSSQTRYTDSEVFISVDRQSKCTGDLSTGNLKPTISSDDYRQAPVNYGYDFEPDVEEDEGVDIIDEKHWDRFEALHREFGAMPLSSSKKDGEMVTIHNSKISGMRNACKLLSVPPEFRIKKPVECRFILRDFTVKEKENQLTTEFSMDQFTRTILSKMIDEKLIEKVNGVLSIGREAVILHADAHPSFSDGTEDSPKEFAIKVFRSTPSDEKKLDQFVKDDQRFNNNLCKQTRKSVSIGAEKEMAHLKRLKRAGIPCPRVVALKHHVLVMSFIGEDRKPAPMLKDVKHHMMELNGHVAAYNEVIDTMKKMYQKTNLIHTDLSEYNILWYNNKCYIIDVSQSVEPSHENAFNLLFRDCTGVIKFFAKKGVLDMLTPCELFTSITGYDFQDKITLRDLQKTLKMSNSRAKKNMPDLVSNAVGPTDDTQSNGIFET